MKKFLEKDYYIFSIYTIGIINWFFKLNYLYTIFIIGLSFFIILKKYERKYLIPAILIYHFAHYQLKLDLVQLVGGLIIVGLYSFDIKRTKNLSMNKISIAMLLVLLVMAFSIFYSIDIKLTMMGIYKYGLYTFILIYLFSFKEDKKMIIVNSIMYLGILVFLEMSLFFIRHIDIGIIESVKIMDLGWGGFDLISLTFIISFIISTIGYLETYRYKYLLLIFAYISLAILTLTKGSYISILIISIPYAVLLYNKNKKNTYLVKQFVFYVIIALLFRLFVSNPTGLTTLWYDRIGREDVTGNKYLLIKNGLDVVRISPLFGLGANISSLFITNYRYLHESFYFPNFIIQTLSTIGIIGLIALVYYIYTVIRELLSKNNYNLFILLMFIVILIQGLFDASFYTGIVMIILSVTLSGIERKEIALAI